MPPSQAAAQSLDSQNGPYPGTSVQATQDSQSSQSSQSTQPIGGSPPSTPTRRNLETSRDLRLMIRTALLFKKTLQGDLSGFWGHRIPDLVGKASSPYSSKDRQGDVLC